MAAGRQEREREQKPEARDATSGRRSLGPRKTRGSGPRLSRRRRRWWAEGTTHRGRNGKAGGAPPVRLGGNGDGWRVARAERREQEAWPGIPNREEAHPNRERRAGKSDGNREPRTAAWGEGGTGAGPAWRWHVRPRRPRPAPRGMGRDGQRWWGCFPACLVRRPWTDGAKGEACRWVGLVASGGVGGSADLTI